MPVPTWINTLFGQPITAVQDQSMALVIGVFAVEGTAHYLNRGMRLYLGGETPAWPCHAYFVNPPFNELRRWQNDGLIFEGILTLGDGLQESRSLRSHIWRQADYLLVVGELDVLELDQLNTALSRTNQQINNLQRELLKKNHDLENALQELRDTQAMLIHAERMNALGQLVAGVAHEINNPLGFIIANIHSLKEQNSDLLAAYKAVEAQLESCGQAASLQRIRSEHDLEFIQTDLEELIDSCQDGLGRIQDIVAKLRQFSRLHAAERDIIDVAENLNNTLALAKPQIREKSIEVELALAGLPAIECYPAELNQVFMNLIVNATQAMQQGGKLTISGERLTGERIELRFADSGHGIPAQAIDRIFEPFYTTKPAGSNTGLGLAISQKIIEEHHGGQIEVTSTPDQGTTFILRLPVAQQE